MAIRSQELTADRVLIVVDDGTAIAYTSEQAAATGSVEAAREEFLAMVTDRLAGHIPDRCLYLGIDESFRFTELTSSEENPDDPPTLRAVTVTKGGDIELTAFDGRIATIAAAEIDKQDDEWLGAKIAELCAPDGAKPYPVATGKGGDGKVISIDVAAIGPVAVEEVVP